MEALGQIVDTRKKNALTKYEIAPYKGEKEAPKDGWLRLGKWIPTITDESEDKVEAQGFYDGDGTEEETVDGFTEKYTFEGFHDTKDPAKALIAKMRSETGDGRKVWLKVTDPDKKVEVSRATVTNIKYRGGNATEYAPFNCTISRDTKPTEGKPTEDEE